MTAEATPRQASPITRQPDEPAHTPDLNGEDELKRHTPEDVIKKGWLPYKSARVLREKVYRYEVTGHTDGGRVTFTLEDIREENSRKQRRPLCQSCRRKSAA